MCIVGSKKNNITFFSMIFAQETYYSFEYKWSLMSLHFYQTKKKKTEDITQKIFSGKEQIMIF